jgi:hypothetical protein
MARRSAGSMPSERIEMMATIIPAKDVGKAIAEAINESLAEIPDDKTKIAVLNAFSRAMFYHGFKGDDNGGADLLSKEKCK